ncbi:hypothetical protein BC831DRAFT_462822 [Entophlyctis helioformis]|nr:hypothetical protein BC831DRAFT_462822 [Entophlyctis helioformis]
MLVAPVLLAIAVSAASASKAKCLPKAARDQPKPAVHDVAKTVAAAAPSCRMRAVEYDNKPSADSVANWYDTRLGNSSATIAAMRIVASVPSVNLANVAGISSIRCTNDSVSVAFSSASSMPSWKVERTLLIIAAVHKCGANGSTEFAMRLTDTWVADKNASTLTFTTSDPADAGVTGTFEIVAAPAADHSAAHSHNITKRSFLDKFPGIPIDQSFALPLKFDKDIVKTVDLPIPAKAGAVRAGCNPCGVHSRSVATFYVKGALFKKSFEFIFEWQGDLEVGANLAFEANILPLSKQLGSDVPVFTQSLSPINIPGILSLGPTISFAIRAEAALLGDGSFGADIRARIPDFRATVRTKSRATASGFKPVFDVRMNGDAGANAEVSLSLVPKLALSASIFNFNVDGAAIFVDAAAKAAVGARASTEMSTAKLSASSCASLDISVDMIGELAFKKTTLFRIPQRPVFSKCVGTKN